MDNRFKLGHSGKLHSSEVYCDGELMITADVVDLLNEQDATIKELEKENIQLTIDNKELRCTNIVLYKANEQLKIQNEMLSDELEQAKTVIDKKWSKYLKKKGDDGI